MSTKALARKVQLKGELLRLTFLRPRKPFGNFQEQRLFEQPMNPRVPPGWCQGWGCSSLEPLEQQSGSTSPRKGTGQPGQCWAAAGQGEAAFQCLGRRDSPTPVPPFPVSCSLLCSGGHHSPSQPPGSAVLAWLKPGLTQAVRGQGTQLLCIRRGL